MKPENERRVNIKIHGNGTTTGALSDNVTIHGNGEIEGDLDCRKLTVHGTADMRGSVKAEQARIHGVCHVFGNVSANDLNVKGYLEVHGDCSAEAFRAHGCFQIEGLLNADRVEIRQHGPSRVQEIGGEVITIIREQGFFFNKAKRLVTDTIEGDDIHLEYTKAKTVRGNKVIIGRGCEIDLVEYRIDFQKQGDATVSEHRQLGHGGESYGAKIPT